MIAAGVARALADRDFVDSINPFANSHHSDVTSPPGSIHGGPTNDGRVAFKKEVASFYGLTHANKDLLVDMFGVTRKFSDVTLAHVWPKSYTNSSTFADAMGLPQDFPMSPRNFLLLPRAVHVAFDTGKLAFIPSKERIVVRIFSRHGLGEDVLALDGVALRIPQETPYKRTLGWFAWLAKGKADFGIEVDDLLQLTLTASQSAEGNIALGKVLARASGAGRLTIAAGV